MKSSLRSAQRNLAEPAISMCCSCLMSLDFFNRPSATQRASGSMDDDHDDDGSGDDEYDNSDAENDQQEPRDKRPREGKKTLLKA